MRTRWSVLLFVAACSEAPLEVPEGCQPIAHGADCVLPYPSDFFRGPDGVDLTGAATLRSDDGTNAVLHQTKSIDAFSRWPLIVAKLPSTVAADRLVTIFDDYGDSLDPATSATLILDPVSGRTVPHYVDSDEVALVLHPVVALDEDTRYVVAIHGVDVAAPEGFARIRDGGSIDGYDRFEDDVFGPLEAAGVERSALRLAWDFTTGADEAVTRDMRVGREKVLAALADKAPAIVVETVEEEPIDSAKQLVWREIHGEITVPLAVDSPDRGARLLRGSDGAVRLEGETQVPFVAMIPDALRDTTELGRVIALGHGFFGDRREALKIPAQEIGTALNAIVVSIDWQGMSMRDVTMIVDQLVGDPAHSLDFTDRVHQSMFNWLAFTHAIRNGLVDQPAFRRPDGTATFDPSHISFIGISQGHILGGVLGAVNPDLDRITLHVGGAGLTHMMYRSKPFEPFLELLALAMTDPLERLTFVATMQRHLDVIDPATYAPRILDEPFAGTPAGRKVLVQIGVADTSVPDVTGFFHANLLGAGLLMPSPFDVYGLAPFEAGGDVGVEVFDFGADRSFMATPSAAPSRNEVHDGLRILPATKAQLDAFFRPGGEIVHTCDGPCDPE